MSREGMWDKNKIMNFIHLFGVYFCVLGCGYMPWCLYEGQCVTIGRLVFFFQPVGPGGTNASGQALVASIFTY